MSGFLAHAIERMGAQLTRDWIELRSTHASPGVDVIDIAALHAELDTLEARLARRRLQVIRAAIVMPELPHAYDDEN